MSSIKSIISRRVRRFVTSVYDPLINVQIGNQSILAPLSHSIKENVAAHPNLNYNLGRVIKYMTEFDNNVRVIDIGANIGDTVAYIRNFSKVPVLCIDGDEKYLNVLRKNIAKYTDVFVCKTLVGKETSTIQGQLKSERGTAFIEKSTTTTPIRTLEDILDDFPDFKKSRLLKIDTDGYDAIILNGSSKYLKENTPVLFFEFDPYLIAKNNDDPFALLPYLNGLGYKYVIFYMSNGDYLTSCDLEDDAGIVNELVHYYSGRNITLYADLCVYPANDKKLFDHTVQEELKHFKNVRQY
jgi:FkbM family methyltransferase